MKTLSTVAITAFAFLALANFASAQDQDHKFQVSSTTFKNNTFLPISAIHNITIPNGTNGCSINGAPGGNESPELSWTGVPRGTASFVVITFDTLGFTHWGMYNIPPTITKLPENAGVAGSAYGQRFELTVAEYGRGIRSRHHDLAAARERDVDRPAPRHIGPFEGRSRLGRGVACVFRRTIARDSYG